MKLPTPLRVAAAAEYDYDEELYTSLIRTTRFKEPVSLAMRKGKSLLVPRNLVPFALWYGKDHCTDGTVFKSFAVNCNFAPRNEDQKRVLGLSSKLLKAGKSHVIEASTGFGKTVIGVALSAFVGLKTLVIVNKRDMMAEWADAFLKFTTLSKKDIGFIQQNVCEYENKSVCIGMIHSLAKDKYPVELYDQFGLVIWDECHHVPADTFKTTGFLFPAARRLGLSATPRRIDGKEFVVEAHIGEVCVKAKLIPVPPKILVQKSTFKLPRVSRNGNTIPMPHEPGKVMHIHKMLARFVPRNKLIAKFVKASYDKGRYTVVMSDLGIDLHLKVLHDCIGGAGVPENEIAYYVGGMKESELEKSITKKVVLATYGMTAEATDVPWWSAMVLATPRANVQQAIGRILREYPDKPQPVIFDIVDEDSWVFREYFSKRFKTYTSSEIKGTVVKLN
jgi:hypothetical protein